MHLPDCSCNLPRIWGSGSTPGAIYQTVWQPAPTIITSRCRAPLSAGQQQQTIKQIGTRICSMFRATKAAIKFC